MNMRHFGYVCFALAMVLALFALRAGSAERPQESSHPAFNPANATTTPGYYTVERVVDGDTIIVWKDGENVTVRLLGMDTPEVVDPRKPVECWGPEASAEGKHLMTGTDVRLVSDHSQDTYDKYGRFLAYVYLPSGLFYNEFMIANGFAHEYTFKKSYAFQKEFKAAQAKAKAAKLGFWSPASCNGNTGVGSATTTAR